MRIKSFNILAVLIVFGTACTGAEEPVFYADDYAAPGTVIQTVITGEPLESVSVVLLNPDGEVVSRNGAFSMERPDGTTVTVGLLGIPSILEPGIHTLAAAGNQGKAEWRLERSLTITESDYPERVLNLTDQMNTLLQDESERKQHEARELWDVLGQFDAKAVYHPAVLQEPLPGGVLTAPFGDRRRYRYPNGSETSSVHYGRDTWAETGTEIKAPGKGRVLMAKNRYLTGNTVILEHLPGFFTLYYHLDSIFVGTGEMVNTGQAIGTVGKTGFATGEHLHWEMRIGGTPVSPDPFLAEPLLDINALNDRM